MRTLRLCVAAGLLAAAGCGWAAADKNMIRGHLHFLAADEVEGREAGTRGYDVAAQYVERYHQPNDDLGQPFNFDAAARFADLNYRVVLEIANAAEKPAWNRGDFFGDTFRK